MSERDAFGRGRNEDTLAGMGWREPTFTATIAGADATPAPVLPETAEMPAVEPPAAAGPTWSPPPPRRAPVSGRTRRRRGPRAMTRLLFLGIVAAAILFALREGTDVLGDIEDAIRGQTERSRGRSPSRAARCCARARSRPRSKGFPTVTSRPCASRRIGSTHR